jgi:hypothetical protein
LTLMTNYILTSLTLLGFKKQQWFIMKQGFFLTPTLALVCIFTTLQHSF